MAAVKQPVAFGQFLTFEITFDSVTQVVSRFDWNLTKGSFSAVLHQAGKQDVGMQESKLGTGFNNISAAANFTLAAAEITVSWSSV